MGGQEGDKAKSGVKSRVHAMLPCQAFFLFNIVLAGGRLPSIPLPLFLQQSAVCDIVWPQNYGTALQQVTLATKQHGGVAHSP